MAEIVNLRTARKRRARQDKEQVAAENRVLHGRPKTERRASDAARRDTARALDGHKLDHEFDTEE
jgi:hypothetical protein